MDRTGKTHQLGEWQPRGVKGVLTTHVLGLVRAVKVTGEDTRLQVDGSLGREAQGNGLQLFSAGSQTEGEGLRCMCEMVGGKLRAFCGTVHYP